MGFLISDADDGFKPIFVEDLSFQVYNSSALLHYKPHKGVL